MKPAAPSIRVRLALALWLLAAALPAQAQDSNSLPTLEALVKQWVELRSQLGSESRQWLEQEAQWKQEIGLLEREQAALKDEIDSASRQQASATRDQLDQLRRQDELRQILEGLRPALDRAEADLRAWVVVLPPALREPLAELQSRLPADNAAAAKAGTAQRVQTVVALYAQIEELGRGTHVVKEILADERGTRREMDVLYLGLARAYAVSPDQAWAAVGTPAAGGWAWAPQPDLAPRVRRAIDVQQEQVAAELVALPIQVQEPAR